MARDYDERVLIGRDTTDYGNTLAHVAANRGDPELFKVSELAAISNLFFLWVTPHWGISDSMLILRIYNPQCMCRRVTVVVLSVCLSACYHASCYLPHLYNMSKIQCHRALGDIFKVSTVWLSLKTLCSTVLASFAGHHHLPHSLTSSLWT